jgi:hypothetical protein
MKRRKVRPSNAATNRVGVTIRKKRGWKVEPARMSAPVASKPPKGAMCWLKKSSAKKQKTCPSAPRANPAVKRVKPRVGTMVIVRVHHAMAMIARRVVISVIVRVHHAMAATAHHVGISEIVRAHHAMVMIVHRVGSSGIVRAHHAMAETARPVQRVTVRRAMAADHAAGHAVALAGHAHPDAMAKRDGYADHRRSL